MTPAYALILATGSAVVLVIALWLMVRSWRLIRCADDRMRAAEHELIAMTESRDSWLQKYTDANAEVERLRAELSRAQPRDPVTGRLVKRAARKDG